MQEAELPAWAARSWWAAASGRERRQLLLAIGLATAATLAAPALLALSGYLLARAAQAPPILTLATAIVGVRLFGLLRAVARYAERLVTHDLALRRLGGDRVAVFSRLIPKVPGQLGSRTSTDVLDRLVADVDRLQDLPIRVLVPGLAIGISAATTILLTALLLPGAALALGAVLAAQIVVLTWIDRRSGIRVAEAHALARERVTRELVVALDAAPELVAFGADARQAGRVSTEGLRLDALVRRSAAIASAGGATSTVLAGAASLVVLLVAAQAAANGGLAPELVPALALAALGIADAVAGLSDVLAARGEVAAAGSRLSTLLTGAPEPDVSRPRGAPAGARLTLRGVRVVRGGRALLDHVDLDLYPGERVALMGPSGAGKSTLGDIVAGFVVPDAGSARLGDIAIGAIGDDALRSLVSWAPQDPFLFPTTLAANLLIAAPTASESELERAIRAVGGGPWLDHLPDGLQTMVGEQGERCSGGERQRVGLARALLHRSLLVVLDEPASQLPHDEAIAALQAVLNADVRRGALLITHRSREAYLADRLVHLADGRT